LHSMICSCCCCCWGQRTLDGTKNKNGCKIKPASRGR
jgi:hypothetical protein